MHEPQINQYTSLPPQQNMILPIYVASWGMKSQRKHTLVSQRN